jgi:hypothetical protein
MITNASAQALSSYAGTHLLEAGHFALDEATDEIASLVRRFLDRVGISSAC